MKMCYINRQEPLQCHDINSTQRIYRLNEIPNEIPKSYFMNIEVCMEKQKIQKNQLHTERNKFGAQTLTDV